MDFDGDGNPIDKPTPGSTLIAAFLYDKIPGPVQLALWQLTRKKYPTLQEILNNIKETVKIADMHIDKSSQALKNKPVSNVDTPSSTVSNVSESKSKSKFIPKYKKRYSTCHVCIYCKKSDHISALCPTEYTADKRKSIIMIMSETYQECDRYMRHKKGSKKCY